MTKKKILLTFDYELFFGTPSGSVEKCILEPTDKIIKILNKYDKKGIFFIDTLYLEKLREIGDLNTLEKIHEQLRCLVANKHRIELHLHPHWLDAKFENNSWHFTSYRYYRLHALPQEKIITLFQRGKAMLEDIAKEIDTDYKVIAFRAGGWSIEPFMQLKNAFVESNILVDSSVGYGMKLNGVAHHFDFTNVPLKALYRFEESVTKEKDKGRFIEVPITTYKTNILKKILRRLRRKLNPKLYQMFGDGKSVGGIRRSYLDEISTYEMLSLESTTPVQLLSHVDKLPFEIITIISHPKGMSAISFQALESLCKTPHAFIGYEALV